MRLKTAPFFIVLAFITSCGPKGGSGGGDAFWDTLNFITNNGLPGLNDLLPGLPKQFSALAGVETSESGLPSLPGNLSNSKLKVGGMDFSGLLDEATGLSAQGFSEARRIEALVHNLAQPVFGLVGRADVFTKGGGDSAAGGASLQGGAGDTAAD